MQRWIPKYPMLGIWDIYNIKQKNHEISHRSLELREKECLLLGIAKRLLVNQFEAPSPPAEQIWMQNFWSESSWCSGYWKCRLWFCFIWILFQGVLSVIVLSTNFPTSWNQKGFSLHWQLKDKLCAETYIGLLVRDITSSRALHNGDEREGK